MISASLAPLVVASVVMNDGWTAATPRFLADVDGDKKQDVVGFGFDGVWIAKSNGSTGTPADVLAERGSNQGWSTAKHVRLVGDIDGDGKEDLVGFGDAGVYTALSNGSGFGPARFVVPDQWSSTKHARYVRDINGDGFADIVGFGDDGIHRALGGPSGFGGPLAVLREMGVESGYHDANHPRLLGDVDGDGLVDAVGFGERARVLALVRQGRRDEAEDRARRQHDDARHQRARREHALLLPGAVGERLRALRAHVERVR
jgi:FG-GAP-like repeat